MRVREGGTFTTAVVVVVAAAVFTTLELPTTGELTMLSTIHRQSHTHAHAHLHTHTQQEAHNERRHRTTFYRSFAAIKESNSE